MTAYRETPSATAPVRTCVIGGVRTPALLGVAFLPLLFALVVFSTRDDFFDCIRDGQNDRCVVKGTKYPLADVIGIEIETDRAAGSQNLYKLVFLAKQERIPLERTYSSYVWDHRGQMVKDFDAFLLDANAKRFPGPWINVKTDIATAILALISLALMALALRRRGMAILEVNDEKGILTITRDMTPGTAFKMVRTTHRLDLAPVPMPMIEDEGRQTYLSLSHGSTTTKLIEAPLSSAARGQLMNRLTAFLSDPASTTASALID